MVPEPHIAKEAFFDRWKSYPGAAGVVYVSSFDNNLRIGLVNCCPQATKLGSKADLLGCSCRACQ
jgi:hypothetical protein